MEEGGDTVRVRERVFAFALPERRLGSEKMEPCLVMAGLINGGRTKKALVIPKSSIVLDVPFSVVPSRLRKLKQSSHAHGSIPGSPTNNKSEERQRLIRPLPSRSPATK